MRLRLQDPTRRCAAGALLLMLWTAPDAVAEEATGSIDWPATIAELRDALYQRPGHAQLRQQLAIAYNNYGVSLGNRGEWALAAEQLEEALELDAGNEQFRQNLARTYLNHAYQLHQDHEAQTALRVIDKALALDATLAPAYQLKGEIEYDRQRLKEAKAAWERALALDPGGAAIAARLAQVNGELPIESKFERLSQSYFDLRYEEPFERPVGFDVRDALLEARRAVGRDFSHWPTHRLVVLIYGSESFRSLRAQTPEWVSGQFDGKIRLPLPGTGFNAGAVRQILFHEYTHAVIHDLTGGRCPAWLNEGLAEYEGRMQLRASLARLTAAHAEARLIPWQELSGHFSPSLSADEVGLAYEEAYGIVAFLVQRYGFWRIRRVLRAIRDGEAWDEALASELRLKLPKLEATWKGWLPELLRGEP